jgi:hypothetical protein
MAHDVPSPGAARPHTGPITSVVAGRTDQHPIDVPPESFVIPADVVSALGEGNTNSGMAILTRMFGKEKAGKGVPIMAAGGEFVVGPQAVARVGGGDLKRGHKNLRDFVLGVRREHVATLRKLKGPHR